jgi:hypothetical protein
MPISLTHLRYITLQICSARVTSVNRDRNSATHISFSVREISIEPQSYYSVGANIQEAIIRKFETIVWNNTVGWVVPERWNWKATESVRDEMSHLMHDIDSVVGLRCRNLNGDEWIGYGDKQFFSGHNRINRARW